MSQVLVSTKYQVVIPKEIRREMHIKSGQKVTCIAKNGVIYLIPDKPLTALRGFAKGISKKGLRERADRL